jgi:hypothetical protein
MTSAKKAKPDPMTETIEQRIERLNLQSLVFESASSYVRPYKVEYTNYAGERMIHECSPKTPLRRALSLALDDVGAPVVRDADGTLVCDGIPQAEALSGHISAFELTEPELQAALAFIEEEGEI